MKSQCSSKVVVMCWCLKLFVVCNNIFGPSDLLLQCKINFTAKEMRQMEFMYTYYHFIWWLASGLAMCFVLCTQHQLKTHRRGCVALSLCENFSMFQRILVLSSSGSSSRKRNYKPNDTMPRARRMLSSTTPL